MNKVWSVVTLNFDMPTKTAKWGNVTLLLHSNAARFETKNKASHTKWPPIQIEIRCFCSSWIIYKNNRIRRGTFFLLQFHSWLHEWNCLLYVCFFFIFMDIQFTPFWVLWKILILHKILFSQCDFSMNECKINMAMNDHFQ